MKLPAYVDGSVISATFILLLPVTPIRSRGQEHGGGGSLVRVLSREPAAMGSTDEAIAYAKGCRGLNEPDGLISAVYEEILLAAGQALQKKFVPVGKGYMVSRRPSNRAAWNAAKRKRR